MTPKTQIIAEAYYTAMNEKAIDKLAQYIHPEATFIAPGDQKIGKETIVQAASGFIHAFEKITICNSFGNDDQAVLIYELFCPEPIGKMRVAALMHFKDGLIIRNELFFDPRPLTDYRGL